MRSFHGTTIPSVDLGEAPSGRIEPTYAHHQIFLGYYKMIEESSELGVELGKLAPFPVGDHPDGRGPVIPRVLNEMADLYAAMDYFLEVNELQLPEGRRESKLAQFHEWVLDGLKIIVDSAPTVPSTDSAESETHENDAGLPEA